MPRYHRFRKKRGTSWTPESSKRANKARWNADRERRDAEASERIREMMIEAIENLPNYEGAPTHIFQIQNLATGKVDRWLMRRGNRIDQVTMESMNGKRTGSHGWTWIMDHLRGFLAGTKI